MYLCQGRPGNIRDIVPMSKKVKEIWEKIYFWLIVEKGALCAAYGKNFMTKKMMAHCAIIFSVQPARFKGSTQFCEAAYGQ